MKKKLILWLIKQLTTTRTAWIVEFPDRMPATQVHWFESDASSECARYPALRPIKRQIFILE